MSDDFHPPASDITVIDPPHVLSSSEPEPMMSSQADYFGFSTVKRHFLPDGASYVELKVLNEGERRAYLNETNREVKFARGSGDAHLRMRPGDDKMSLLKVSIVGWNLIQNGQPLPFNLKNLDKFLTVTDPRLIDSIEKEVRRTNPWLLSDMSVEDIDEEIANLQEMRQAKIEEEEGKDTSSTR